MDIDECYVVMNGPSVYGVFESLEHAILILSQLYGPIKSKRSFNGNYLLMVKNYPEFRAVRTRMY